MTRSMGALFLALVVIGHGATASPAEPGSCEAVKETAVGAYARCLLGAEARFTRDGRAVARDSRRSKCRRRFDSRVGQAERLTCGTSPSVDALAEATELAADNLRAMIEGEPGESVYYKAAGAANCPEEEMIRSANECQIAGAAVGHTFSHVVEADASSHNGAGRPAGCFWDQNGASYFNTNLSSSATWGGTGGLCLGPQVPPTSFEIVSTGTCEDHGLTTILDLDECRYAGSAMSGDPEKGFRYDQPPGGYSTAGTDRTAGCTFHDANVRNPLQFFPFARGECGTYNFHCVCAPG